MIRSKDLDTIAPDDPITSVDQKGTTKTHRPSNPEKIEITPKTQKNNSSKQLPSDDNFYEKIYNILGHTKSPFSSFLVRPKVLTFSERDDGEEIYLAIRPHWVTNLRWMVVTVLMLFIPLSLSNK